MMKTIKFHKTECGVDFLLNVLRSAEVGKSYLREEVYNTDYFEIVFFKKGKGHVILNHQKLPINDHTLIFISPFQKRQWVLNGDEVDFTSLVFQEEFLNDFFSDKLFIYRLLFSYQLEFPLTMQVDQEAIARYSVLLAEIKAELLKTRADSVHIIRSLIYYLLQKLNRAYAEKHHLPLENHSNSCAFQYKQLIETHIGEKQRINDYTELLGLSRVSLNKAVKAQFNLTATQLLKQRLLAEIKEYLIHSGLTIAEIAYHLNFSEPNHLVRFFKNQTGTTTTAFLADYQNGIKS